MLRQYFFSYIEELKSTLGEIDFNIIQATIQKLIQAREKDKQIFIIGNGGSASAASHMACDLGKGTVNYQDSHFKRFRVLSLSDNIANITAIGNDISYDDIFVEQLKNFLNPGDVVIVITASGNSPNIVKALEYSKSRGAFSIGLLGFGGGKAGQMVDLCLAVPSRNYGISEDFHMIMIHILTQLIRRALDDQKNKVLFIDRDGILNEKADQGKYIANWEKFVFKPEIFMVLKEAMDLQYKIIIISNQQGIGKGIMSEENLLRIHANMLEELARRKISIDGIYFCPHLAETGCSCRKPGIGMFHKAMNDMKFNIDLSRSYFFGDSESDILAGRAANLKTVYLSSNGIIPFETQPDFIINSLPEILPIIQN